MGLSRPVLWPHHFLVCGLGPVVLPRRLCVGDVFSGCPWALRGGWSRGWGIRANTCLRLFIHLPE